MTHHPSENLTEQPTNAIIQSVGLNDDETAFYYALEVNDSAVQVLGHDTLNKWGYPPDKQQKAIDTVMKQAEMMADGLVG
jgi:type I restriction enzyme R subunit